MFVLKVKGRKEIRTSLHKDIKMGVRIKKNGDGNGKDDKHKRKAKTVQR